MRVTLDVGTRLKNARKEKGYTQKRVAEIIGMSRASISSYERNAVDPPLSILRSLADLYGVSSDYLLDIGRTAIEDVQRMLRR